MTISVCKVALSCRPSTMTTFNVTSDHYSQDNFAISKTNLLFFFWVLVKKPCPTLKQTPIEYVYITWPKWSLWDMNLFLGCTHSIFMAVLLKSAAAVVALDSDIPLLWVIALSASRTSFNIYPTFRHITSSLSTFPLRKLCVFSYWTGSALWASVAETTALGKQPLSLGSGIINSFFGGVGKWPP